MLICIEEEEEIAQEETPYRERSDHTPNSRKFLNLVSSKKTSSISLLHILQRLHQFPDQQLQPVVGGLELFPDHFELKVLHDFMFYGYVQNLLFNGVDSSGNFEEQGVHQDQDQYQDLFQEVEESSPAFEDEFYEGADR